jgi:lipoprotein-releasing system ATP-binding protein
LAAGDYLVQVRDVYKSFTSAMGELEVLKGIDLDVIAGEMLGIVGASGAGKSTLLYALGALEKPSKGTVLFKGEDVFRLTDRKLSEFRNRNIGFIFQLYHLLPDFTVLENIILPALIGNRSLDEATAAAKELLSQLGLTGRLEHKPGELSGGEQQRVAIARALVNKPTLVLADEPTGNLDSRTGEEIYRLLRDINLTQNQTFVIVTHNNELADKMDRVLYLVDGKVSWIVKGDNDV